MKNKEKNQRLEKYLSNEYPNFDKLKEKEFEILNGYKKQKILKSMGNYKPKNGNLNENFYKSNFDGKRGSYSERYPENDLKNLKKENFYGKNKLYETSAGDNNNYNLNKEKKNYSNFKEKAYNKDEISNIKNQINSKFKSENNNVNNIN